MKLDIKIKGSGTKAEIIASLGDIIQSLNATPDVTFDVTSVEWEDATLITEVSYSGEDQRIWSEIRDTPLDEKTIDIDGYLTDDDNEAGKVIAQIDIATKVVTYKDERARTDTYAQEVIRDALNQLEE